MTLLKKSFLVVCGVLIFGANAQEVPVIEKDTLQYLLYSQKIIPAHSGNANSSLPYPLAKWGYKDLQDNWIITPQYRKVNNFNKDGIAEVILEEQESNTHSVLNAIPLIGPFATLLINAHTNTDSTITLIGLIDINGNILTSYKSSISQKREDKKYKRALEIVSERRANGIYDDIFTRFAEIDAEIFAQQQREQARQDSVLAAQRRADSIATAKRVADSIALAEKRFADSLNIAKERKIIAKYSSGNGLSLSKVKVTGHGMLLSKDKTWREYTVRMDDFNRICVTYEGTARLRGELDVLKTIYESDWSLLPDNLFQSIQISKCTLEISRGAYTKKFGIFSFLVTVNLNDFNNIYTDEEANLTVSYAISQVERFISSFMNHYQSSAYIVEPLYQFKVGGREGITVGIVDKQGNGASLEDVKRICNETLRSIRRGE